MEDLAQKIAQGDQSAFAALYERYKNKVYNTVLSYLQNRNEAEEIAQDVFVEIHHSIHKFRGESSLNTWIYRIAVTKSLDFIKYKNRKKRFAFLTSIFEKDSTSLVVNPPEFVHPGVLLENQEKSAILFKAIHSLPDNQKTAFILARVEGLSHKEISEIMQVSVGSVESLLHRSRENLKKQLENFYKQ